MQNSISKISVLIVGLLSLHLTYAMSVFDITTSDSSIFVPPNETATITYTIKNTSGIDMPQMRYFPPALTTLGPAGTCGSFLANKATCTVELIFHAPAVTGNLALGPLGVCGHQGRICSVPNQLNRVDITIAAGVFVAAGEDFTGTLPPLLADSKDRTNTWSTVNIPNLTNNGIFLGASCTGLNTSQICVITGIDFTLTQPPLLVVSTNGGNSWAVTSFPNEPANGILYSASCLGAGATALCVVAGEDYSTGAPLIVVSNNGAKTWGIKAITGAPLGGVFFKVSCTGSGSTAICAAAGQNFIGIFPPLIAASMDGGNTWSVKNLPGFVDSGSFSSVNCNGSGVSAVCVAVGQDTTSSSPLIAVSTDGGNTWNTKAISGFVDLATLFSTSCSGTLCIAVGQDLTTGALLIVASIDGGNTWSTRTVPSITDPAVLNAVNCTGTGANAVCSAVGQDNVSGSGVIVVSNDNGNTWLSKTIPGVVDGVVFSAQSATGTGSKTLFVAAGEDTTSGAPFIAVSKNGGNTWQSKTIVNAPSVGEFFSAGASISKSIK